ncbi:ParB N-terminal domain-containing protein [Nocardioides sp.]|uniref:ParB N-terminal domain-containing protein n=1 Tax=Nocardioides sp. TaxID=35761 RepID=UPI003517DF76
MLFQFLPRLADDEYAALEKSIQEHGIQVPIVVDENASVIDGHHRKEIADRLGIDCPRRTAADLTDEQKRTLALSLNLDRRHLTREQKRALVLASIKADPHLSDRQHAERTGADHKTVGVRRAELEATGEIPQSEVRIGANGVGKPLPPKPAPESEIECQRPTPSTAPVQQPPARRRRPLPDAFRDAAYDAEKKLEALARLVADDRWPKNAEEVAARNRHYLIRINDLVQQVINSLPEKEHNR